MLPAVAATLAWTDRPAPWRPRHVSTVAAASPPWQATTFARNAGQANSEVTSAIAFANSALRGRSGQTPVCRPVSNAAVESLQRKVIRFAHLVCVESSMTKMRKGAAKSASQAPFLKVWAPQAVQIAVLGATPARKGSLSALIAGLGTTNLLWLPPVASNVNQAVAAIPAMLLHLALNALLEAMQCRQQTRAPPVPRAAMVRKHGRASVACVPLAGTAMRVRAPPATRPAVYAPAAALEPPRGWEASRVASSAQLGGMQFQRAAPSAANVLQVATASSLVPPAHRIASHALLELSATKRPWALSLYASNVQQEHGAAVAPQPVRTVRQGRRATPRLRPAQVPARIVVLEASWTTRAPRSVWNALLGAGATLWP